MKRLTRIILSIYLYNEYQGYTQLKKLRDSFKSKFPADIEMLDSISKHANDEKKHHLMFQNYFNKMEVNPLPIDSKLGYIDQLVLRIFGKPIVDLDQSELLETKEKFHTLLRTIMITEERGLKQVEWLLSQKFVRNDRLLHGIFAVIHRDEPSHFMPYKKYLEDQSAELVSFRERFADFRVHYYMVLFQVPKLYLKSFIS